MNGVYYVLNSHMIHLLRCPVCHGVMDLKSGKSLFCPQGHTFDISKFGYINLLLRAVKTKYDRTLFRARKQLISAGKLEPLIKAITVGMINHLPDHFLYNKASEPNMLLDAGCGEGSLLIQLQQQLVSLTRHEWCGVGLDISKEGILLAAKEDADNLWCVADLARMPFRSSSFPCVLNILSPSNYEEFHRLLTDDGIIIKVIPGSGYLQELRSRFYEHTAQQAYDNIRTIEHFSYHYHMIHEEKVSYTLQLNTEEMAHLVHMTPLTWGIAEHKLKEALKEQSITFEYHILYGTKKNNNLKI